MQELLSTPLRTAAVIVFLILFLAYVIFYPSLSLDSRFFRYGFYSGAAIGTLLLWHDAQVEKECRRHWGEHNVQDTIRATTLGALEESIVPEFIEDPFSEEKIFL